MSIDREQGKAHTESIEVPQIQSMNSRSCLKIMILAFSFVWLLSSQNAFATGDCNGVGGVTIDEVQSAINMFLGISPVRACVDESGNGSVSIDEVQKTINSFLGINLAVSVSEANDVFQPYDAKTGDITFAIHPTSTFTYNVKNFAAGDRLVFDVGTNPIFTIWNESGTDGIIDVIGVLNGMEATIHLTAIDPVSDGKVFGANSFRTVFGADSLLPIPK